MDKIDQIWNPLASACTSVQQYISILISIEQNNSFSQGEQLALLHFTTCVVKNNPTIAEEVSYVCGLFLNKNFKEL